MAFTRSALDDLLAVTASDDVAGPDLVLAAARMLAVAADAESVSVFELEPRTRTYVSLGEVLLGDDVGAEDDGIDELFWDAWDDSPCSWTERTSPWYGRYPAEAVLDPERLYPTWRSYAATPMMLGHGRYVGLGHEVVIPLQSSPGRTRRVLVNRPAADSPFTDDELMMLRLLQPHLDSMVRRAVAGVPARDLLSPRELEILSYVRGGRSTKDIAATLWVQQSTVRKHLENIYAKLEVHGRTEAVAKVWGHPGFAEDAG
jgi:DNA-binding CsgD family transcriptional regulator